MEIVYGVASGIVVLLLARAWHVARRRVSARRVSRAFPLLRGPVAVVLGSQYVGTAPRRPLLYVPLSGVDAFARLSSLLGCFGAELEYFIDEIVPKEKSSSFEICIGGMHNNSRTRHYLEKYCPRIFRDDDTTLEHNEARIIKIEVPLSEAGATKTLLIMYGGGRFETMCAVAYFCDHFLELVGGVFSRQEAAIRIAADRELGHHDAVYVADDTPLVDSQNPSPPN